LNQTAAEYAYYFVQNLPVDEAARRMSRRYNVEASQAAQDYHNLAERFLTLIEIPDLDPVTFLDFEREKPYAHKLVAPYRLDCALTYTLSEGSAVDAAPTKNVERELSTDEWKAVFDKAWLAGIPHIVFTGGEPTLREDLPLLIAHAESIGQVSGLLTDGMRLAEPGYLHELLQTGLDHVMIILQPDNELAWGTLESALAADIFTAVHLTLTTQNAPHLPGYLDRLAKMGCPAISLSSQGQDLDETLLALRNQVAALQMSLVWDLPVPYSAQNPVALETAGSVEGAGRAWLYVEPDGDVLPTQGAKQVLGNFLKDSWETIWKQV
jgi:MoaA/NifB/PqqE/SkfB family radical SAM enzyme